MIRVQGLTKAYGDAVVVDDVSFDVASGEAVALWGHNGAGKTTIVRCLFGLVSYRGDVSVGGHDARRDGKEARRLMGHVPQELSFFDDLAVGETLALSARLRGVASGRIDEVLGTVGLAAERGKKVGSLSGGMKQRLAIALALLADPPVLVLDEPTSNLDAASRESMLALLEELRGPGRSLLLTSHHLEEVGLLADRVITLEAGRAVLECPPDELAERLGLRSWLHLLVEGVSKEEAASVLVGEGFTAWPNSRGVLVDVSSQDKARALQTLARSGIDVRDFEVWR